MQILCYLGSWNTKYGINKNTVDNHLNIVLSRKTLLCLILMLDKAVAADEFQYCLDDITRKPLVYSTLMYVGVDSGDAHIPRFCSKCIHFYSFLQWIGAMTFTPVSPGNSVNYSDFGTVDLFPFSVHRFQLWLNPSNTAHFYIVFSGGHFPRFFPLFLCGNWIGKCRKDVLS